jgi:hypothetical protein
MILFGDSVYVSAIHKGALLDTNETVEGYSPQKMTNKCTCVLEYVKMNYLKMAGYVFPSKFTIFHRLLHQLQYFCWHNI